MTATTITNPFDTLRGNMDTTTRPTKISNPSIPFDIDTTEEWNSPIDNAVYVLWTETNKIFIAPSEDMWNGELEEDWDVDIEYDPHGVFSSPVLYTFSEALRYANRVSDEFGVVLHENWVDRDDAAYWHNEKKKFMLRMISFHARYGFSSMEAGELMSFDNAEIVREQDGEFVIRVAEEGTYMEDHYQKLWGHKNG